MLVIKSFSLIDSERLYAILGRDSNRESLCAFCCGYWIHLHEYESLKNTIMIKSVCSTSGHSIWHGMQWVNEYVEGHGSVEWPVPRCFSSIVDPPVKFEQILVYRSTLLTSSKPKEVVNSVKHWKGSIQWLSPALKSKWYVACRISKLTSVCWK